MSGDCIVCGTDYNEKCQYTAENPEKYTIYKIGNSFKFSGTSTWSQKKFANVQLDILLTMEISQDIVTTGI